MRKPSPISISSPRETSTSRPSASAASASSIARGVVVDDDRRLGAGQPAQQRSDVVLPRPARSFGEVVLEVRVAAADVDRALDRGGRQRGAAEVRVDDHAGRVQHAAEGGPRARTRARRRAAAARSPGSAPARISSRARARTARAASTARGSSLRRVSSSTEGRSRSSTLSTIREWESAANGPSATRRGHCFTVRVKRAALVLLAVVALAAIGAAVARALEYRGAAKPGVRVLGIDVGGKSRAEIDGVARRGGRSCP